MLVRFIFELVRLYEILIAVWCIMSWFPMRQDGVLYDVAAAIGRLVEPYLGIFRHFIPPFASIDFSPVVAMLALELASQALVGILL